jgi:tetratricopeptide (TPR) repeat protein
LSSQWIIAALVVLAALPFLPVLCNGFVNWDDHLNIESNMAYRGLGWANLHWAWTTFHLGVYQPLEWMLLGLQYLVFGLRPWGYHLASLLLHAMTTAALFGLVVALLRRNEFTCDKSIIYLAAAIASCLWAVHPLRVEAVAWVSCQGYLPSALLAVLSVWAYIRAHPEESPTQPRWMAWSLFCYLGSLVSHGTSLGLPVVLLALDYYPLERMTGRASVRHVLVEKWPFILTAAVFAGLALYGKRDAGLPSSHLGPTSRPAQAAYAACWYVVESLFPVSLHAHHAIPPRMGLGEPIFLAAALAVGSCAMLALYWRNRRPAMIAALTAYLAILAPTPGLVNFGTQLVADRYAYLASIPWIAVLAALLIAPIRRWPVAVSSASMALAAVLGVFTWEQCLVWRDSESLWTRVLACGDSRNPFAHHGLGGVLYSKGRLTEAEAHLRLASELMPTPGNSWFALGVVLGDQNKTTESIAALRKSIDLDPTNSDVAQYLFDARRILGSQLVKLKQYPEAAEQFAAALSLRPDSSNVMYEYGKVLAELGRFKEAAFQFRKAVNLLPGNAFGHRWLGRTLAELGRLDEARTEFEEAVRLSPGTVSLRLDLGMVLTELGRRDEAIHQLRQALEVSPANLTARRQLDQLLTARGEKSGLR